MQTTDHFIDKIEIKTGDFQKANSFYKNLNTEYIN